MKRTIRVLLAAAFLLSFIPANAMAAIPPPGPSAGSSGVQGVIPKDPPTQPATIVTPTNGGSTANGLVTVSGSCPNDTLVRIYSNGIFVGSVLCKGGSYSVQVQLFNGRNELTARVFDVLDQEGPVSNTVVITFNDAAFAAFGSHVSVSSGFARRGTSPNQDLTWPISINGGVGPYALSVDWGDGSPAKLQSIANPGELTLTHKFASSGSYNVFIRVVDKNGTEGFLQVVAVISGTVSANASARNDGQSRTVVSPANKWILLIALISIFIIAPTSFWLGRRYELAYLRQQIERDTML